MHLRRVNIKIIFSLLVFIIVASCDQKEKVAKLCTDYVLDEMISTKYEDSGEVNQLWQHIKTKGHTAESGNDSNLRPKFVNMQFMFESALSSMTHDHQIKKSIAVIHAPYPSTPLRTDGNNLEKLVPKDVISDPDRLNTLILRVDSLYQYLSTGGSLYMIYKGSDEEESIPGFNVYKSNLARYPNLFDVPVSNFNERHAGSSYLITCENGQQVLFSITGRQLNDVESGEWSIYYGGVGNRLISERYAELRKLYKQYKIDFVLK